MIKRLLGFVVLAALGFVVLHFAIGGDGLFGSQAGNPFGKGEPIGERTGTAEDDPSEPQADRTSGSSGPRGPRPGVIVDAGGAQGKIQVAVEGSFSGPRFRNVKLPDGSLREVRQSLIEVRDSRQLPDGRFRLEGLKLTLYELRGDPRTAEPVPSGTLIASTAIAVIGVDAEGQRSFVEDKDIDLHDAVLTTPSDAKVPGLRLAIEHALVRQSTDRLRLRTARPSDAFDLTIATADPLSLSGRGVDATLPTRPTDAAPVDGPPVPIEIKILNQPRLVYGSGARKTTVRARGALTYREDSTLSRATIQTTDHVEIEGQLGGTSPAQGEQSFVASGNRLDAVLLRGGAGASGGRGRWQFLRLLGRNPDGDADQNRRAKLILARRGGDKQAPDQEPELECRELLVWPNDEGQAYRFTATGSPRLRTIRSGSGREAERLEFDNRRRLHLIRFQTHVTPWLRVVGIPPSAVPRIARNLVIFEGRTTVRLRRDGQVVDWSAADGMFALFDADRGAAPTKGTGKGKTDAPRTKTMGAVVLIGRGEVAVSGAIAGRSKGATATSATSTPLAIRGKNGFRLVRNRAGKTTLDLGQPDQPDRLTLLGEDVEITGSGWLRWTRNEAEVPSPTSSLRFVSSADDIRVVTADASVFEIAELDARFANDGIESLRAIGGGDQGRCRLMAQTKDGKITGSAPVITSTDPRSVLLEGTAEKPASLARASQSNATAPDQALHGTTLRLVRLPKPKHARPPRVKPPAAANQPFGSGSTEFVLIADGAAHVEVDLEATRSAAKPVRNPSQLPRKANASRLLLDSDRLVVLPDVLPTEGTAPFARFLPQAFRVPGHPLGGATLRRPTMLALRNVVVQTLAKPDAATQSIKVEGTARGASLLLQNDADGGVYGVLQGTPGGTDCPSIHREDAERGPLRGSARVVWFHRRARGQERIRFAPQDGIDPLFELPSRSMPGRVAGGSEFALVRCAGPIDADGGEIDFGGPVEVLPRLADGSVDPDGMRIRAGSVRVERNRTTGAIERLFAASPAAFDGAGMKAEGREMIVDLRMQLVTVTDREHSVRFERDGMQVFCSTVRFNYKTGEYSVWHVRGGVGTNVSLAQDGQPRDQQPRDQQR